MKNELFYRHYAKKWEEALPVGNGRIGAMVFGNLKTERIALNEDSLWSGYPKDFNKKDASKHLSAIRKAVFDGNHSEARRIANEDMHLPLERGVSSVRRYIHSVFGHKRHVLCTQTGYFARTFRDRKFKRAPNGFCQPSCTASCYKYQIAQGCFVPLFAQLKAESYLLHEGGQPCYAGQRTRNLYAALL